MNFLILMGSVREKSNTAEICKPFIQELNENNVETRYVTLADKNISSCKGCNVCQNFENEYGCVQKDDMHSIVKDILWADCIVLATPIYSWYCTAEMKKVIDRHYGLNKFYGKQKKSLWAGKKIAIIATHGYDKQYAVEPFEMGIKRLCKHSKLDYIGLYSVRNRDNRKSFTAKDAVEGAKLFALYLVYQLASEGN